MKSILSVIGMFIMILSGSEALAQLQVLSSASAPLDKSAVKGRFAGTYQMEDRGASLMFLTDDNVLGYHFSADGKFDKSLSGDAAIAHLDRAQEGASTTSGMSELPEYKGMDVLVGHSSLTGNMRLKTGRIYLSTSGSFIYGVELEEKETLKPKAENTWMSKQIGFRSYVPHKQFIITDGKGNQALYTLPESGRVVAAPSDGGLIQGAGIIVEKVSIKNPSRHGQNRIVVFSFSGNNVDNPDQNIIISPYNMQPMGVGNTSDDGFAVMVMPLNAPSTYKPHKRLMAEGEMKTTLFVYRFNKSNELVDSARIPSASSVVNFQYLSDAETNTDVVFGFGNDKPTKWRWAFAGMELNVMQFIKLKSDGTVDFHKTYSGEEIAAKLVIPGAKKSKMKLKFTNAPVWDYVKKLDNGNYFFYGYVDGRNIAMLTGSDGELKKFFVIPPYDPEKAGRMGTQIEIRDNNIYLAVFDQPHEFTNDVQTETFSTTYSGAYVSTTVTSTKTTQLFEIFHTTQLIRIDGGSGDVNHLWLGDQGKEFYTMHNDPVVFGDDAMYIAGREKGPKGKTIYLTRVSY